MKKWIFSDIYLHSDSKSEEIGVICLWRDFIVSYSFSTFSPMKWFFVDEYLIRRFIFHNKILIWSLNYVRNPKSWRSSGFETFVVISTRLMRKTSETKLSNSIDICSINFDKYMTISLVKAMITFYRLIIIYQKLLTFHTLPRRPTRYILVLSLPIINLIIEGPEKRCNAPINNWEVASDHEFQGWNGSIPHFSRTFFGDNKGVME